MVVFRGVLSKEVSSKYVSIHKKVLDRVKAELASVILKPTDEDAANKSNLFPEDIASFLDGNEFKSHSISDMILVLLNLGIDVDIVLGMETSEVKFEEKPRNRTVKKIIDLMKRTNTNTFELAMNLKMTEFEVKSLIEDLPVDAPLETIGKIVSGMNLESLISNKSESFYKDIDDLAEDYYKLAASSQANTIILENKVTENWPNVKNLLLDRFGRRGARIYQGIDRITVCF